MLNEAIFDFFLSLNDFLSAAHKNLSVTYKFKDNPAVKDAIEALGIPHTEVDLIIVNDHAVDFFYKLNNHDRVKVHPVNADSSLFKNHSLTPHYIYPLSFVVDVNLGKLAKALRMLGFDTCYENHLPDKMIAALAAKENRIALTRDVRLLNHKTIKWGYWIRSQKVKIQLQEVAQRFQLLPYIVPFKRCITCNGLIEPVTKESVTEMLLPDTISFFNEFFQCSFCRKVYWKGSHYENMLTWISDLKAKLEKPD